MSKTELPGMDPGALFDKVHGVAVRVTGSAGMGPYIELSGDRDEVFGLVLDQWGAEDAKACAADLAPPWWRPFARRRWFQVVRILVETQRGLEDVLA